MKTRAYGKMKLISVLATALSLSAFAAEVDITAAVREAGKGTTTLNYGNSLNGYNVDNAFGATISKESRVMLIDYYNRINWSIGKDFEQGKPVIVTGYTIRRAWYDGAFGAEADHYSRRRAPSHFFFQVSPDGENFITIDERTVDWRTSGPMEQTFAIDSLYIDDYRHYRLVIERSEATSDDSVKCSFQYVKLFGTIGDPEPLSRLNRKVDYLVARGNTGALVDDFALTFDSKLEIDLSFTKFPSDHQAIFAAGYPTSEDKFRLFYSKTNGGWWFQYGTSEVKTGVMAYPGARYKVVVDGPDLYVNGSKIGSAGDRKTGAANSVFTLFSSLASADNKADFSNCAYAKVWSVKAYDGSGTLTHDLQPVCYRDGGCRFYDAATHQIYGASGMAEYMTKDFGSHKWLTELTSGDSVGTAHATVTLVKGACNEGYSVTNAFSSGMMLADRALFTTRENIIQYDIRDDYHPGYPIILARYGIQPCVAKWEAQPWSSRHAPRQFELQASKDGVNGWVTLSKRTIGCGPGSYEASTWHHAEGDVGVFGVTGIWLDIPEELRGDYRHYRFITIDSSADSSETVPMAFQRIRFLGYDGGFEPSCEPVEYVQNAKDQTEGDNTYVKTGVTPSACDLTIEMKGAFTRADDHQCLFCARDKDGNNTWTLFLLDGKLRLDCKTTGTGISFVPVVGKIYTIKVEKNKLYVDGELICTGSSESFTPGSEIVLMASHKALGTGTWHNQARFKLHSCKITDSTGGVLRDFIPAKRSDGTVGLVDRVDGLIGSNFTPSSNGIAGPAVDTDFRQRDRSVTLATEVENARLPYGPISLGFGDNQRIPAKVYAAFDNECKGNTTNGWSKVVAVGTLTNGMDSLSVKLDNPEKYRRVKFFVCDDMACAISHTQTYRTFVPGLTLIIR